MTYASARSSKGHSVNALLKISNIKDFKNLNIKLTSGVCVIKVRLTYYKTANFSKFGLISGFLSQRFNH